MAFIRSVFIISTKADLCASMDKWNGKQCWNHNRQLITAWSFTCGKRQLSPRLNKLLAIKWNTFHRGSFHDSICLVTNKYILQMSCHE